MMLLFLAISMIVAMLTATLVALHEEAQDTRSRVRARTSGRFGPSR